MSNDQIKKLDLLLSELRDAMYRECKCGFDCENCAFGMIKECGELKTCSIDHVRNTIENTFNLEV